jgi:hypothetical protein
MFIEKDLTFRMVFYYVAKLELVRGKGTSSYSYIKNYLILQRVLWMVMKSITGSSIMSGLTGENWFTFCR